MEFLIIASAHFMALLSPGPDFFSYPADFTEIVEKICNFSLLWYRCSKLFVYFLSNCRAGDPS